MSDLKQPTDANVDKGKQQHQQLQMFDTQGPEATAALIATEGFDDVLDSENDHGHYSVVREQL